MNRNLGLNVKDSEFGSSCVSISELEQILERIMDNELPRVVGIQLKPTKKGGNDVCNVLLRKQLYTPDLARQNIQRIAPHTEVVTFSAGNEAYSLGPEVNSKFYYMRKRLDLATRCG